MINLGELNNFIKQMLCFSPFFRSSVIRASVELCLQLQKQSWSGCVDLQDIMKATK